MQKHNYNIEVAFALPSRQKIISLNVPSNTSVYEAIKLSKIYEYFADIVCPDVACRDITCQDVVSSDMDCPNVTYSDIELLKEQNINQASIGIFGKKIDPTTYVIQNNDRIEIYRPLNNTPNQKRLERAKSK